MSRSNRAKVMIETGLTSFWMKGGIGDGKQDKGQEGNVILEKKKKSAL